MRVRRCKSLCRRVFRARRPTLDRRRGSRGSFVARVIETAGCGRECLVAFPVHRSTSRRRGGRRGGESWCRRVRRDRPLGPAALIMMVGSKRHPPVQMCYSIQRVYSHCTARPKHKYYEEQRCGQDGLEWCPIQDVNDPRYTTLPHACRSTNAIMCPRCNGVVVNY